MPDFDPDKFLHETKPSGGFDPDKFLEETAQKPVVDKHDLAPFLKEAGSGLMHAGGQALSGLAHAAMNPAETASNVADSLTSPDLEGAYRTVRNIPVAGPAIDSIVSSGKALGAAFNGGSDAGIKAEQDYHADMAQHDAKHAQEHPLTDFIQRSVGSLPLAPEQAGAMATDAFGKSLAEGNDTWTAMKDARNALVLAGAAMAAGHAISSPITGAVKSIPGKLGISEEAMAFNAENPSLMKSALSEAPVSVVEDVAPSLEQAAGPFKNFPTKAQMHASSAGEFPDVPVNVPEPQIPTDVQSALANQFKAGTNPGHYFADLGQKVGGAVGGGSGAVVGHTIGATVGVPVGMAAGKALGGLVDTYGAPAVKVAQDAGIALEKVASTPYIGPLMRSAAEGPQSLAVTHYMLSQTDPKYQALTGDSLGKIFGK